MQTSLHIYQNHFVQRLAIATAVDSNREIQTNVGWNTLHNDTFPCMSRNIMFPVELRTVVPSFKAETYKVYLVSKVKESTRYV